MFSPFGSANVWNDVDLHGSWAGTERRTTGEPLSARWLARRATAAAHPIALAAAALILSVGVAAAQAVPRCDALTLYGNAATSGLCRSLSMGNLQVCELANTPDIHATFGAAPPATAMHITVRNNPAPPGCEGNSYLTGTWNAAGRNLAIAAGQPNMVCGVGIQNWVNRFNAQTRMPAGALSACVTAFNAAAAAGRINPATQNFYIGLCNAAPACP